MYERPETPNSGSGDEKARSESSGDTSSLPVSGSSTPPTGSYNPPPSYNPAPAQDPYGWQPGQYQSPPTQPQGGYGAPQGGQPTQYMPPPPQQQGYAPNQYQQQPQQQPQYPAPYQGGYPQQPAGYGYGQPPAAKDSTVALLLELIGLIGFLGIGHIYAGKTNRGIGLLIGWFAYNIIGWWLVLPFFATITCGIGCLLIIPMLLLNLGVPIGSGLWIKNEMDRERVASSMRF